MAKKIVKVDIVPNVVKTLRENTGYTIEEIAKALNVKVEKVINVENGKDSLTLNQVKKLASIMKVPLAAFFSSEIPHIPSLPDYRINREKRIDPSVYMAIRKAKYFANMIHEISGRETIIPHISKEKSPRELAMWFRKFLGVDTPRGRSSQILSYYKRIIEEKMNILVIEYPMKTEDVRAFSIKDKLSIIVLNENDESSIKLFSLFHEIAHVLRKEEGICSIVPEQENRNVERFCDSFAAEFLVPYDEFVKDVEKFGTDYEAIKKMQKKYSVSVHVLMLRLLNLGYISKQAYNDFRKGFDKEKKTGGGGKNWEMVFRNRVGNIAIEEVSKAFRKGEISFYEAMRILDLKAKYAERFIG